MIQHYVFGRRPTLARVRRAAFFAGVRAVLPVAIATGVWGLVTGVAMVKVGLTQTQALGMSLLVFAGAAQLASLPLMAANAPVWVILLTAAIVNLRFVIFSAGLYPFFRRFTLGQRLWLGYLLSDSGFALSLQRWLDTPPDKNGLPQRGTTDQVWFYLGIAATNWFCWQPMSIIGIFAATAIPGSWGLEFAAIIALLGLIIPMINTAPALVGAIVAAVVAVAAAALPLKLGLVIAVTAGILAALGAEFGANKVRSLQ